MIKNILAGAALLFIATTSVSAMSPTSSSTKEDMMKKEMMKDDSMMKKDMMKMTAPTSDLYMGAKGDAVTSLQKYLEEQGFLVLPSGVSHGYFGGLTKKAVMKYQESLGVTPTGYFGPITRSKKEMKMMKDDTMMKKDTMKKSETMTP